MFAQRKVSDGSEGLHVVAVGEREFVEFCGDGLGLQGVHVAPKREVHVGLRGVGALGAGAEEFDGGDFGMMPEDAVQQGEFAGCERGRFHALLLSVKNRWSSSMAGR